MYKKPLPSVERLRFLLSYDPETGYLRWKNPPHYNCTKGVICPIVADNRYRVVTIDTVTYLQHRVIWTMVTGFPPPDDMVIDHKNSNTTDNRWSNLQCITNSENVIRSPKHVRAPSVVQDHNGSWKSWVSGKYEGRYATEKDARLLRNPLPDRRRNKTPIVRVRPAKSKSSWEARVYIDGKRVHLGTFPTKELAEKAEVPKN